MTIITRSKAIETRNKEVRKINATVTADFIRVNSKKNKDISEWFIERLTLQVTNLNNIQCMNHSTVSNYNETVRAAFYDRIRMVCEIYYFINTYLDQALLFNNSNDFSKLITAFYNRISNLRDQFNSVNLIYKANTMEEKAIVKELCIQLNLAEKVCGKYLKPQQPNRRSTRILAIHPVKYYDDNDDDYVENDKYYDSDYISEDDDDNEL